MTWATCNRTEWACGCITWLDLLPNGAWLTRQSPCRRHSSTQEGQPCSA
jgi:hypothetical protein